MRNLLAAGIIFWSGQASNICIVKSCPRSDKNCVVIQMCEVKR